MDYKRFLGKIAARREASPLNLLGNRTASAPEGTIYMSNGFPNPECFPFKEAAVTLRDGTEIRVDGPKTFQYTSTSGLPGFIDIGITMMKEFHNPPTLGKPESTGGLKVMSTVGNMDSVGKVFEAILNESDHLIVEEYTYPPPMEVPRALGAKVLRVAMDRDGMIPSALREVMSHWKPQDSKNPESDIPRLLYIVPNGQNPTGSMLTLERRKEIYQIAQEYDMLILEDDPYYFNMFDEHPLPSILSMDVDGRVIRCDSFAKTLSAGLRVSFMAGPAPIIDKLIYHMMCTSFQVNSLAQVFLLELWKKWGVEGLTEHAKKITKFYLKKRDIMIDMAEKHLSGLAEWYVPKGGFYLWVKLKNITGTEKIMEKAFERGLAVVPGEYFAADRHAPNSFIRLQYAMPSAEQIEEGFKRLASVLKEEQGSV